MRISERQLYREFRNLVHRKLDPKPNEWKIMVEAVKDADRSVLVTLRPDFFDEYRFVEVGE